MANVMTKSNVNYSSVTNLKSHSDLDKYIKQLYDGKPNRKQEAKAALIRSGVLNKKGEQKDVIVSWE